MRPGAVWIAASGRAGRASAIGGRIVTTACELLLSSRRRSEHPPMNKVGHAHVNTGSVETRSGPGRFDPGPTAGFDQEAIPALPSAEARQPDHGS